MVKNRAGVNVAAVMAAMKWQNLLNRGEATARLTVTVENSRGCGSPSTAVTGGVPQSNAVGRRN